MNYLIRKAADAKTCLGQVSAFEGRKKNTRTVATRSVMIISKSATHVNFVVKNLVWTVVS